MESEEKQKQALRRKLLEGMCNCAENVSRIWAQDLAGADIVFNDEYIPRAFKPNVNDKYIFNTLIEKEINKVYTVVVKAMDNNNNKLAEADRKIEDLHSNQLILWVAQIMAKHYWPFYGEWIKKDELNSEGEQEH